MKGMARASDFLRAASDAIGVNVNTVSPDVLDRLLSEHHLELARLVTDGSQPRTCHVRSTKCLSSVLAT